MRKIISLALAMITFSILSMPPALAHGVEVGPLKIHHPWTRATPKGADVAGGFMSIENTGKDDDRLIAVSVSGIKKTEIHEMSMNNGMMKMRPLADGILIPAGKTVLLKPGSFHVMMMGLGEPLMEGDYIKATLTFEKAGKVDIEFAVEAQGANLKQDELHHTQ